MSLNRKLQLVEFAKIKCRLLRKNATVAENILWQSLKNRRLNRKKFSRQYPIFFDIAGPETFFIVDFYCYESKLVIELDGEIHRFNMKKDIEREKILNLLGYNVLRFTNDEVEKDLDNILNIIADFTAKN